MAVFTPVEPDELARWLAQFDVGAPLEFQGIPSGIENSNFFLKTERGDYVLTIFERLSALQLPFYLELMRHFSVHAIACPAPVANRDGKLFATLREKPAALVTRLPGKWVVAPSAIQCARAAGAMAQMHLAGRDFALTQPNLRGLAWWQATAPSIASHLDLPSASLLTSEVEFQLRELAPVLPHLPSGPIHADLFRDNALFVGDELGGFIDFYFAGCDAWLFDVAVSLNDWCIELASGAFISEQAEVFLRAYASIRAFTDAERTIWPAMLRAAALRFWMSRLWDIHRPRPATLLTPHDPTHFERILRLRRSPAAALPALPG